jgi:hypothetical protein
MTFRQGSRKTDNASPPARLTSMPMHTHEPACALACKRRNFE